jgi:hypothetical protein
MSKPAVGRDGAVGDLTDEAGLDPDGVAAVFAGHLGVER